MNSFAEAFALVKKYIEDEGKLSKAVISIWIDKIIPVELNGDTAVLMVNSNFQRTTILSQYKETLEDAFLNVMGFPVKIDVVTTDQMPDKAAAVLEPEAPAQPAAAPEEAPAQSFADADYAHTFDTFIVGESNRFAYGACTAVAKDPGKSYNPLFIYGDSGLGKTHLMHAIAHEVSKNYPDFNIIYVTSEAFGNEFISCISDNDMQSFHEKYRNADLLLIDDIQFFTGKERMQEEFFHTFNDLHTHAKQIVITSDKPPKELKGMEMRLVSRFESGLPADISSPDYETRIAIIRRKAELLDLYIPEDVIEFIASRLKTNIRQLEGAVKKLKALKHLAGTAPSISMAQNVIKDILADDQPMPITVDRIIADVAEIYGVTPEDIRGTRRASQVSTARKVAIYVVRAVTGLPLQAIGKEFSNRDHSTIVYSVGNIEAAMKRDESLRQLIEDVIKNIQQRGGMVS